MYCCPHLFRRLGVGGLTVIRLLIALFVLAAPATGQAVVIYYGDSIMAGYNSHLPGEPVDEERIVPGAFRWSELTQSWWPVTNKQNWQLTGPDPLYYFALEWTANEVDDLYLVGLAIPGADVNPDHPNPLASFHPSSTTGLFPRLALQINTAWWSLQNPKLEGIMFSVGNTAPELQLGTWIVETNTEILEVVLFTLELPKRVGLRSYKLNHPDTSFNRALIPSWSNDSPLRYHVDLTNLPGKTGGLADGVHPTARGMQMIGEGYYEPFS